MLSILTGCRRLVSMLFVVLVGIAVSGPAQAAMCAIAVGDVITLSNEPPSNCSQYLLLSQSDYDALRNPFGLDPDWSVVYWSAGATLLLWALGFGSGAIFSTVRKTR